MNLQIADARRGRSQGLLGALLRREERGGGVRGQRLPHDLVQVLGAGHELADADLALAQAIEGGRRVIKPLGRLELGDGAVAIARIGQARAVCPERSRGRDVFRGGRLRGGRRSDEENGREDGQSLDTRRGAKQAWSTQRCSLILA